MVGEFIVIVYGVFLKLVRYVHSLEYRICWNNEATQSKSDVPSLPSLSELFGKKSKSSQQMKLIIMEDPEWHDQLYSINWNKSDLLIAGREKHEQNSSNLWTTDKRPVLLSHLNRLDLFGWIVKLLMPSQISWNIGKKWNRNTTGSLNGRIEWWTGAQSGGTGINMHLNSITNMNHNWQHRHWTKLVRTETGISWGN